MSSSVRNLSLKRSPSSLSSYSLRSKGSRVMSAGGHGHHDADDLLVGAQIQMTAAVSGVVPDDTFSVSQAVNALGFGRFQIVLSFLTGLCWMADSMEIMILSILSPALHCEWGTNQYRQAFLTTVVFLGMMLSSTLWGQLSDRHGRRQALLLSSFFLFFYGLLSSIAPNFGWIAFLRFLVGVMIGCVPQSVTLFSEFLPTRQRGKCVVLLDCFWAFGACAEVLLAALIMPLAGWRWLLAISALPSLVFAIGAGYWLPESAKFNAARGQSDAALDTLERIACENRRPMLLGRLVVDGGDGAEGAGYFSRGRIRDLLSRELRRTTLSLWFTWTACSFIYYGVVLMTTELFESPGNNVCKLDGSLEETCSAQCSPLDRVDYGHLLWTTLAEFPGIMITIALIERIGRRRTMALEFILACLGLCILFRCTGDRTVITAALFLVRGAASGVFQAAYVYTPEVYPTVLRSVGVGSCSGMARTGAMLTPYVAQVMMKASVASAVAVYAMAAAAAAIVCFFLPVETQGMELPDHKNETRRR